jgi:hypothetical protein
MVTSKGETICLRFFVFRSQQRLNKIAPDILCSPRYNIRSVTNLKVAGSIPDGVTEIF